MSDLQPVFNGEMQLMNWGESSANGAWVKFWITPEDLEAFRSLKCKSGKIAGHRVAAVLVEIGDDELPVQREPQPEKPKGGVLAKLAGMLCDDTNFWDFLTHQFSLEDACESSDAAATVVREVCEIESRSELDWHTNAADRFHAQIRGPWLKWRAQRGLQ
jgi:hypothetical protein